MLTYRFILVLVTPIVALRVLVALLKGRETFASLAQRRGHEPTQIPPGPVLWVHGASVGELTSAKAVIQDLLGQNTDLQIVVTSNTQTGRDLVNGWNIARVFGRLAPFDTPRIASKFLAHWQPAMAITLENEIWPARTLLCKKSGIPVIVLAGRMSAKSAANWARFPKVSRSVMGAIDSLLPQDSASAQRFENLGTRRENIRPCINLKASVSLTPPDPAELAVFSAGFARHNTILAASTHEGDEALILQAFLEVQKTNPAARLIIAPRHPERFDDVARTIKACGLTMQRRSTTPVPSPDRDVYLADTMGEMALLYAASALTILGGSFSDRGGHTPFEPVQFGSLVLHGPDVSNHQDAYNALARRNAAFCVDDADELGHMLGKLPGTGSLDKRARAATAALAELRTPSLSLAELADQISRLGKG